MPSTEFKTLPQGKEVAPECEAILRALPDWFGIEESIVDYVEFLHQAPVIVCLDTQSQVLGFIGMKQHSPDTAEIYIMAVSPTTHRQGIGRELVEQAQRWCRDRQISFLQVKTLDKTREDANYAKTRLFYEAQGFKLLEVFPTLWDPSNPCAMYAKWLGD